ncbi:MAG: hypothetical protein A3I78_08520 [Gammaproteobacteria bacterium RIFCSPLOWO2_02_FULL_56_15]|nr:MAG: hypothetical protein A3I78_08520 [Gammaproteobacteria bacterium RIFCSPLOWO2_02_FULL_56_15]
MYLLVVPGSGLAYELSGEEWEAGQAGFYVNITAQNQPADDTAPQLWNNAFIEAMAKWNTNTVFKIDLTAQTFADPCAADLPPKNGVSFSVNVCGLAWNEGVIAITLTETIIDGSKNYITKGGIIFNDGFLWNVYDGPWAEAPFLNIGEFRRVAVHELGHIVGLGHPVGDPDVIMRANQDVGDTIVDLQADDIAGVVAIYDTDADSIGRFEDNCPVVANTDQLDTDIDSLGDACDPDDDGDTVADGSDNCPLVVNTNQANTDGDGLGDACDPDDDGDTVADGSDNCPLVVNADQANLDGDGLGDVCDPDDDGDTVADGSDNCPLVVNTGQANTDGDAMGDACDPDDDNDGVLDGADAFPLDANESADTDSDGVGNNGDNCPLVANSDQADGDSDGVGDVCDAGADTDGDGDEDATDNCPLVPNSDQANLDGDALGDACDPDDDNDSVPDSSDAFPLDASESMDTDGDGIGDNSDNCKLVDNSDQLDSDGNGIGNACEEDDGFTILLPVIKKALE